MNCDGPMWSQDEAGRFGLVFPNKHALSLEDIMDIFSKYGKVATIQKAGDERGFRFVQYNTLEEVENAVANLKNHPLVKLIPYRPKPKNNRNSNNLTQNAQDIITQLNPDLINDNARRNFFQRKPASNRNLINNNKPTFSVQGSMYNGNDNTDIFEKHKNGDRTSDCDNESVYSNGSNRSHMIKQFISRLSNGMSQKENVINSNLSDLTNTEKKTENLLHLRGITNNSFALTTTTNSASTNTLNSICDDSIPDLVTKDKIAPKVVFLDAQEVIVANIHDNYGGGYILHLFDRFEPLGISCIKISPKSEIRYCHVYFKSIEDVAAVEKEFDKYNLDGNKLVVLRPCRIIKEGVNRI